MKFFEPPEWVTEAQDWLIYQALYQDNLQTLRCAQRLPLGKRGALRRCKNGARFRRVADDRVLCLVHFRIETQR